MPGNKLIRESRIFSDPGGVIDISRRLSEATPPARDVHAIDPVGVAGGPSVCSGAPPVCVLFAPSFRWYRYAQAPANLCHPSGVKTCSPFLPRSLTACAVAG